MKRPLHLIAIAGLVLLILLACGDTSSVVGADTAVPTATATNTTGPENPASYLTVQPAAGYDSYPPQVDCSNINWSLILINQQPPEGGPTGRANWEAVAGAVGSSGHPLPGTAPGITVSPASGTLDPGGQVFVHISGSFSAGPVVNGGPVFDVEFSDPHAPESSIVDFYCP
jgi:hypothetical protein